MATSRTFAYNTGSPISGTEQVGNLAVGYPNPTSGYNDAVFWNGPDEDLGYVIAASVPGNTQPTQITSDELFLSPTYRGTDVILSNDNQTVHQLFGYQQSVLGQTAIQSTDKVMFSVLVNLAEPLYTGGHFIGIGYTNMNYQGNPYGAYPGNDTFSTGYCSDPAKLYYNGNFYASNFTNWGDGDLVDVCLYNNEMWVRVNGGWWNNIEAANPATPSGGITTVITAPYYPVLCPGFEGTMTIQNIPAHSVPNGYLFLGSTLASVGFYRTDDFNDGSFIGLAQTVAKEGGTPQTFDSATGASSWLTANGYWNSYTYPVLSLDAANYSGSGPWIDSISGKSFTLYNSPSWSNGSYGGYFDFSAASSQYAECSTSLPSLSTWTIGVWHYYTGQNVGSGMCIVTEVYPGSTSNINYSLGDNSGGFSSGFFDGNWRITGSYSLTANNWYYIVGVYDGSSLMLYANGSLVAGVGGLSGLSPISSQGGIRLMRRWDLGDYWGGKLATVDIYGRALNSGQINSIWNSTKSRFGL
jgi:hypothetical protein